MKNSVRRSTTRSLGRQKPFILIFGARGQLGHDLMRVLPPQYEVVGVDHAEVDITNAPAVLRKVLKVKPNMVINTAAYNKVEDAEENASLAYAVNAIGPYNIAHAAFTLGVPVLHVSTDYVFDGTKKGGYIEDDVTHPLNVYGASKEAGEQLVRIGNRKHWIIRTSALFGVHAGGGKGYNFVTQMLMRGREKKELRVVSDQWTAPTYTRDLSDGIKTLISRKVPYGTYHLINEGSTTWFDFAKGIFSIVGYSPKMKKIVTGKSGSKIDRPQRSILKNIKLKKSGIVLPHWQDGLRRYMIELN